jgi:hypothetical protein
MPATARRKLALASTTSSANKKVTTKFFIAFLQYVDPSKQTRNCEESVKNYLREVNSLFVLFPLLHSARTEAKVKRNCLRFIVLEQKTHQLGDPRHRSHYPLYFLGQ